MSVKRTWTLALVATVACLILSACATSTVVPATETVPTQTATEAATPEATTAATEVAAGEVALRWRTRPDNQEEANVYQQVSDTVDKQLDGITLTYEPGGSETSSYQDVLKTEIAAGTAPDVFWIPGTDVGDFVKRGLVLDLRKYADATSGYSDKDFYPGPMATLTYDMDSKTSGPKLWGLPRDVSTFVLYLNMDLINEAGTSDPRELAKSGKWDWAAFEEVAKATTALGPDIKGYGANAWWAPYGVWMNAAGGGFFNADRTACALNTDESMKGLEFMHKLYVDDKYAVPYGEDAEPPFRSGKVAMFQNGRWGTPGVRTVTFTWDVVDLPNGPSGKPGNWLFWGAYVVNAKTEHPEEAWKLVQALTTAEIQGKISALGTNIPSRVSKEALDAFLTFTPPDNNQAFLNGLNADPHTEGPLWVGSWPDFSKVTDAAVSSLATGKTTLDQFKSTICDEANKTFSN